MKIVIEINAKTINKWWKKIIPWLMLFFLAVNILGIVLHCFYPDPDRRAILASVHSVAAICCFLEFVRRQVELSKEQTNE